MIRRSKRDNQYQVPGWLLMMGAGLPVVSWLGSAWIGSVNTANAVATKQDLTALEAKMDAGFKKSDDALAKTNEAIVAMGRANQAYAEQVAKQALDKAVDHSDGNKKDMEKTMGSIQAGFDAVVKQLDQMQRVLWQLVEKRK